MGHWNYIAAAYLAAGVTLGGYWLSIKRRIRRREDAMRMAGGNKR
ncbi:MAG: hypothetical protein ACE5IQ_13395 [Candidatus Methylomirabilales bacterium]